VGVGCGIPSSGVHLLAVFVTVNTPTLPITNIHTHLSLLITNLLNRRRRRPRRPLRITKGIHQTLNIHTTTLTECKASISRRTFITARTGDGIVAITINLFDGHSAEEGGFEEVHILDVVIGRWAIVATRSRRIVVGSRKHALKVITSKCKTSMTILAFQNIPRGTRPRTVRSSIHAFIIQFVPIGRTVKSIGGIIQCRHLGIHIIFIRRS